MMPQIENGPEALNQLLEGVYIQCMSSGGDEESCSAIAWDTAKRAGWSKDAEGNYVQAAEFAELPGVELMYEGSFKPSNWGGKSFEVDGAYLDALVQATENYVADTNDTPSAKLDHGDTGTSAALAMLKSLSLGRVSRVWTETREKGGRAVKVLLADFVGMPAKFLELIKSGLASKRSVEIRRRDGYGPVLDAVAFFGAGQPAVKALNELATDLVAAADHGDADGTVIRLEFAEVAEEVETRNEKKEIEMEELEKLRQENDALKAENQTLRESMEKTTAEMREAEETKVSELAKKLESAEIELTEYKTREQEAKMAAREAFVDSLVDGKKLEPAKRDSVVALCKSLDDSAYMSMTEVLSGMPVDERFVEKLPAADLGEYKGTDDEKIEKWMKAKGLEDNETNYKAACDALGLR